MEILYKADDGKIFKDEYDCLAYEAGLKFPELFSIEFFDDFDNKYFIDKNNVFDDNVYQLCEKIHIYTNAQLVALLWLANECGWSEFYEQILSPGVWVRTQKDGNGIWKREWHV